MKKLTIEQIRTVLFKKYSMDICYKDCNCPEHQDCRECLIAELERVADDN